MFSNIGALMYIRMYVCMCVSVEMCVEFGCLRHSTYTPASDLFHVCRLSTRH